MMLPTLVFRILLLTVCTLPCGLTLHAQSNTRPPKKVKDVRPEYPAAAKQAGIQGVVFAVATIGEDGRVEEVIVVRGPGELSDAARAAVTQWRYEPASMNGKAVAMPMTVAVKFSSDETATAMSLIDALGDPNTGVRLTAMSMLAAEPLGKARDAAIAALKDVSLHDDNPAVRQASTTFLRRISK